ncbi:glycosyltransferase 61 family protein [Psychromonas sp. 14N.309.X.WAT.B.A12]|uniref:glycosyltransferase family 61 protein n=1 Tax=Psychromonas sp. 14N.309.X.WAT.B.A12 TaxID=2998322 RepID=UPI0025B167BD|nr:glycosyltransferase 61 family protein [Psychromonas sp. 14N.309.X.WAT.B.A12]MDN2664391.1 glycosyltransferase 61 family protein [Psychromonas sp. 14N.309.X.WAT.B.A12]
MSKYFINNSCDIYKNGELMPPSYTRIRDGKEDFIEKDIKAIQSRMTGEVKSISEPCFYAGVKYDHFGHFLLESLSRLYKYKGDKPIVWLGGGPQFTQYQKEILSIFGLLEKKHIFLNSDTTFTDLEVIERGYIIWDTFLKEHSKFLRVVKKNVESPFFNKKIWISRAGFKTFSNEWLIECTLKNHGWLIIDPTLLSIQEQAEMFASAKKIAGIEGSAFHTIILCSDVCIDVTIFSRNSLGLNGNYLKIDEVMETKHSLITSVLDSSMIINFDFIFKHLNIDLNLFELNLQYEWKRSVSSELGRKLSKHEVIDKLRETAISHEGSDIYFALDLMQLAAKHRPDGVVIKSKVNQYQREIKKITPK